MNGVVNTEMLMLARESRGMTQSDLAHACAISQGHISKFESNTLPVPDDQLEKIAKATGYPRSFFYRPDRVYGLGISFIYHRKRKSIAAMELRRILAIINARSLEISRLLQNAEVESENEFHHLDIGDYNGDAEHVVGVNATCRMTGVAKNTVLKLLADVGAACDEYQYEKLRNLKCKRIQCDEIWSFCYCKQRNLSPEREGVLGYGDVWTWTALDADTKLIPTWYVGGRTGDDAMGFMRDLASRLANKVRLTTDGHRAYLEAVEDAFGGDIDYAMLVKLYEGDRATEARYSPA